MATNYELYLGGPRQQNTDWAIFPAAPFNAANVSNLGPPSKHPVVFAASRTFDFVNDAALKYFLKKNVTLPMVVGDALGAVVVPSNSLFFGAFFKVTTPVAGTVGTAKLKFRTSGKDVGVAFNLFGPTLASGFAAYDPAIAAGATTAALAAQLYHYFATPDILDLVLVTVPNPATLAGLTITVTPVYFNFQTGMMN